MLCNRDSCTCCASQRKPTRVILYSLAANLFRKSDDRLQQAVNGGLLLITLHTIQGLRDFRFYYEITSQQVKERIRPVLCPHP
jgi:hypothetical protein